jgi:hypothetical protein
VNPELDQHVQLKDAKNLKKMMASRKHDLRLHERKLKPGQKPKRKLPVDEETIVPAEDVVVEYHRLFVAGKRHHLNYPEDPNNPGKMVEVDHDLEVLLLDHVMHLLVDFVRAVTEVIAVKLKFECVQDCQVHSVENTLDFSQPLLQPTPDESSVLNLLQKVALFLLRQPKDVFAQQFIFPCTQIFSGNLRTEVIVVVVVAELVAEDVAVVVAAA